MPQDITASELAGLGSTLGKQAYIPSSLAYVDTNVASGSVNRIVPAELVFMTPDIPDTLILTQASG